MSPSPLLSWGAQIAAHTAFVEAHRVVAPRPATVVLRTHPTQRRTTVAAQINRETLLHALRDGAAHPFADLRAALPSLSVQGVYYLVDALGAEGLITVTEPSRTRRAYQLTRSPSP